MRKITRRRFLKLGGVAGFIGLSTSYPIFIERNIVLINTYRISVPNLPDAFHGFRFIHLTDLHQGTAVPLRFIRHIITQANRIKHDVTICTGDYVHETNKNGEIDSVWPVLAELTATYGVFSVLGNHDHWADTERSLFWLNKTGQNLRKKVIPIWRNGSRIWLAGAGDLWEDHSGLDDLLCNVPESDCRIVLAHNPDTADTHFTSRVDLFISGHTHGGQVHIPFIGPPILPVRNITYSSGLKRSPRGTLVFISKGIGWAILPVRFNCYPEIAVLELISTGIKT